MDWKLELIVVPVSDVDRAKAFYMDQAGFHLDVDHSAGEDFRVVQLTPPGSACSIALMRNEEAPGSIKGYVAFYAERMDAISIEADTHALPAALIIMRNLPLALIGGMINVLFSNNIPFDNLNN